MTNPIITPNKVELTYPDGTQIEIIEAPDKSLWWATDYEGGLSNDTVALSPQKVAQMLRIAARAVSPETVDMDFEHFGVGEATA